MKKFILNVAHDTNEVKRVLNRGKSPLALIACLLIAYLFPLSAFAEDHPTEYPWGEITIQVGEQKTIYIGDDFGYALDFPSYSNFWISSDESCVKVVGSNQTKGYCVIEGVKATSSTKVTCQLMYKLTSDSYQWSVWHGYYNVKVTAPPPSPTTTAVSLKNNESSHVFVGEETLFSVQFWPFDAERPNLTWYSDDPNIATVTGKITGSSQGQPVESGAVKGIKEGETVIRVSTDSGQSDSIKIKVLEKKIITEKTIEGIELNYLVTDEKKKTCEVYAPVNSRASIKGKVTISSNVSGYVVTGLHKQLFSQGTSITSVSIPNTVTYIESSAFNACTSLTSIDLPENMTSISKLTFNGCRKLESVKLPNNLISIGESAFSGCQSLTKFEIPNTVTTIDSHAFSQCTALTSVIIPNSVTKMGEVNDRDPVNLLGWESVFYMTPLTTVISYIENPFQLNESEFKWVKSGATLYIPYGTKKKYQALSCWTKYLSNIIEMARVFHAGDTLTAKTIEGVNMLFHIINMDEKVCEVCGMDGKPSIDNTTAGAVTIPSKVGEFTVTNISQGAFRNCDKMTSINIPNGVTVISPYAFYGCSALTSITISDDNRYYDSRNGCNAIIETATSTLLFGCANTVIPTSVTTIGESAFEGCKGLTSISIPTSVNTIGESAFEGCEGLTFISIPNSVTSIGAFAFKGCSNLASVSFLENVTSIGSSLFQDCSALTSISFPESFTSIGDKMFVNCKALTSVNIPVNVTSIGDSAFVGCSGITSIVLPERLNSIGAYAFQRCTGLTSIELPESLESIGNFAFFSCWNLGEVTSLIETPFSIGNYVFNGIPKTAVLYVPQGTKADYNDIKGWKDAFAKIIEIGTQDYPDGDVNMDGNVNGTDLVALANIILGKQAETESADVNKDGSVNGTDLVALANIILGRNNAKRKVAANGSTSISIEPFTINAGEEAEMLIDLENPNDEFTLVQFDLHLPQGLSIKKTGADLDIDMADRTTWRKHTLDANTMGDFTRFLLYSSSNTLIEGNSGAIIKVKLVADDTFNGGDIVIDNALLVTPEQKEVKPSPYIFNLNGGDEPNPNDNTPLTIETFDIVAGGEAEMLIDLTNPDDAFTLVQFDLHLPQGLSIKKTGADLDIDMADRTTWRKHTLDANTMGDFTRFLLYSSSNTLIEGNSGAIIMVKLVADDTFNGGDIVIDNALLVTPEQKEVKPSPYTYNLDGGDEPNPNDNTPLTIEAFDIVAGGEAEMLIDLDNPDDAFTLVQFDLHLPQGLSIKKTGADLDIDMADRTTWRKHTLDANTMGDLIRFLLYSSSNTLIEGNSGAIIKVKLVADDTYKGGDIVIDNALLVTPEQKEVKPGKYVYTGIKGILMTESSSQSIIYNLSGQRLVNPAKGINIINGKKVVVK